MIDITTASKIRGIIEDAFTLEGNRNFLENYNGNQDELNEFLNIAMQAFEKKNITNNRLKITPAPWFWKDNRLFDKNGIMFGMIAYILNVANEIDANMAIIAAAPEMYVALEHALQFIGRCPFTRNKELELEISQVLAKAQEDVKQ